MWHSEYEFCITSKIKNIIVNWNQTCQQLVQNFDLHQLDLSTADNKYWEIYKRSAYIFRVDYCHRKSRPLNLTKECTLSNEFKTKITEIMIILLNMFQKDKYRVIYELMFYRILAHIHSLIALLGWPHETHQLRESLKKINFIWHIWRFLWFYFETQITFFINREPNYVSRK